MLARSSLTRPSSSCSARGSRSMPTPMPPKMSSAAAAQVSSWRMVVSSINGAHSVALHHHRPARRTPTEGSAGFRNRPEGSSLGLVPAWLVDDKGRQGCCLGGAGSERPTLSPSSCLPSSPWPPRSDAPRLRPCRSWSSTPDPIKPS